MTNSTNKKIKKSRTIAGKRIYLYEMNKDFYATVMTNLDNFTIIESQIHCDYSDALKAYNLMKQKLISMYDRNTKDEAKVPPIEEMEGTEA